MDFLVLGLAEEGGIRAWLVDRQGNPARSDFLPAASGPGSGEGRLLSLMEGLRYDWDPAQELAQDSLNVPSPESVLSGEAGQERKGSAVKWYLLAAGVVLLAVVVGSAADDGGGKTSVGVSW